MGFDTIAQALVVALAGETSGMTTSSIPALPPDPSNAALLYYQAFLSLARLDEEETKRLYDLARRQVDPDDSAAAPSEMPVCARVGRSGGGSNSVRLG